jgi:hypothetical protein
MGAADRGPGHAIDTLAVHAGEPTERVLGSAIFPIFQSATFAEVDGDWAYMRPADTPNHQVCATRAERKLSYYGRGFNSWLCWLFFHYGSGFKFLLYYYKIQKLYLFSCSYRAARIVNILDVAKTSEM